MTEKENLWRETLEQASSLLDGETDRIVAMANLSALIAEQLPDLNWAGFYRVAADGNLVLGPFQGKVACTRIPRGKGVCGTALAAGESQLVPDVHAFPGHIACDSASAAEVVAPVRDGSGRIWAVLDIDSPTIGRFDEADRRGFEALAALIGAIPDETR